MKKVKLKPFPLLCDHCKKSFMINPSEFKTGNVIKCPYCKKVNYTLHQNLEEDLNRLLKRHLGKYV